MKQLFFLLMLSVCFRVGLAQVAVVEAEPTPVTPSRWTPHVDSIFEHIDRSPVSTGLLVNYGVALKDYHPFAGSSLSAANELHTLVEWRLLYGAMQTSIFNGNATLPLLSTANVALTQAQVQQQGDGIVRLATLLARYEQFRADAGTAGLVTRSGQQLYDNPNRARSPYEQHTLVALCPVLG